MMHKNWEVSFYYQYQQSEELRKVSGKYQELLICEPPQLPVPVTED